jgi:beta-glucosidase
MQTSFVRFFTLSVFTGLFPVLLSAQKPTQVEDLLKKMTIEEKVGQMTQLTLGTFVDMSVKDRLVLKKDEIKKTIAGFHIGSVLNNAQDHAQTQEEWLSIIKTIQDAAKV